MKLPKTYNEWYEHPDNGFHAISHMIEARIRTKGEITDYEVGFIKTTLTYWLELIERRERLGRDAQKIEALRNSSGRTPEEVTAFLAKADELEAQLKTESEKFYTELPKAYA